MKPKDLRDERGVAMVLEILLVAAVLVLAGLAVYQNSQRHQTATGTKTDTAAAVAADAASVAEDEAATDLNLSADAEAAAGEVTAADTDVTNLGGSSNASF